MIICDSLDGFRHASVSAVESAVAGQHAKSGWASHSLLSFVYSVVASTQSLISSIDYSIASFHFIFQRLPVRSRSDHAKIYWNDQLRQIRNQRL